MLLAQAWRLHPGDMAATADWNLEFQIRCTMRPTLHSDHLRLCRFTILRIFRTLHSSGCFFCSDLTRERFECPGLSLWRKMLRGLSWTPTLSRLALASKTIATYEPVAKGVGTAGSFNSSTSRPLPHLHSMTISLDPSTEAGHERCTMCGQEALWSLWSLSWGRGCHKDHERLSSRGKHQSACITAPTIFSTVEKNRKKQEKPLCHLVPSCDSLCLTPVFHIFSPSALAPTRLWEWGCWFISLQHKL